MFREFVATLIRYVTDDLSDLVVALVLTLLVVGITLQQPLHRTPLVALFVLPFILWIPGYVTVAVLFPTKRQDGGMGAEQGLTVVERVALSVLASIAVATVASIAVYLVQGEVQTAALVPILAVFVFAVVILAAGRRLTVPAQERFRVPWRGYVTAARAAITSPNGPADTLLVGVVLVSILLVTAGIGYAAVNPSYGERYTEFFLVTENEDGEYVAEGYPQEFTAGQPESLVVGVTNREDRTVSYTVLVEMHRVQTVDNSTQVLERERLARFQQRLQHNETWHQPHSVAPTTLGDQGTLELTYLLYRGAPPQNPTRENAYRRLQLRVNVTSA